MFDSYDEYGEFAYFIDWNAVFNTEKGFIENNIINSKARIYVSGYAKAID